MRTTPFHRLIIGLAAALTLNACSNDSDRDEAASGGNGQSRDTDQATEIIDAPERFEFLRYAVNQEARTPELCLTFSMPLDQEADYSAYVAIDAQITFRVDGSRLCLGGLTYGQSQAVTLREGFPAADGGWTLSTDETLTLTFDDRPAVVDFAGDGIILPRIDADGLGITTVNVDAVDVSVTKVTDRALVFRSLTSGYRQGSGEYSYQPGDERPGEVGAEIWNGRMETPGNTNATVTTVFPLIDAIGTLEPGAYYVTLTDAAARDRNDRNPASAGRWLIVTDLAFTAYRSESGLDLTVRSLQSAEPMASIDVHLIARSNEILAQSRTDGAGHVQFDAPLLAGVAGNTPRLLLAYADNGDFTMLDLARNPVDLSAEPVSGRARPDTIDSYVYLDRGIYRPGEIVQASVLLRDSAGVAVTDRAGAIVLYKPNGIEQAQIRFSDLVQAGGTAEQFQLPQSAARGIWRLAVEMDGVGTVGSQSFSVEDFVPQRIELTLIADDETPLRANDTRSIEAAARFLYGAPGAGLPVRGTARVQVDPNPFPDHEGFRFGLYSEQFAEIQFTLPETVADGDGAASIPVAVAQRGLDATQPLRVRAVIEAEEPGGRAVADDVRIPYRPRDSYVGLNPRFEGSAERQQETGFDVLQVDATGTPIAGDVEWRLVRRDYDYDWFRTNGGRWQWRRSERTVSIEAGVLSMGAGAPSRITTPPLDWGDYALIVSKDGVDLASTRFWVGWRGRTTAGVAAPDQVQIAIADEAPNAGEQTTLGIRSPYAGLAEIVVATDRVISTRQISVPEGGTDVTLSVTDDWGAGAYVMVTVYTPRDRINQPQPRRAVGVRYIPVNVADRTFAIDIEADGPVEPNQPYDIDLTFTDGPKNEDMYATIAAVDEGILLLTGFSSPNPVDWFFGKPQLGVTLHDDYGRLLDPNQGAPAPTQPGGDQIGGAGLSVVPTQTVALFQGPIEVGRNGEASVSLDLPDFNGELRLMVVAWSETGIGAASQPLTVRDDVPAELILPRFLAPGDSVEATATLDNIAGPEGDYQLAVEVTDALSIAAPEAALSLAQGEREDIGIMIDAARVGTEMISLTANGPDDYTVGSSYPIEVRSAFWPESRLERFTLAPGDTYTPASDLLAGFTQGSGSVSISAAATPIDTSAYYQSLYRYPFACTEQLTSRGFPLFFSGSLSSLGDNAGPEGAPADVRNIIETLLSRQNAQGAFGLWRVGDNRASPWIGVYTTDFMTRAASAGYPVPEAALRRALDAIGPIAQGELYRTAGYNNAVPDARWTTDTRERLQHRSSAYALYVLARNGRPDRSRLRYMHDELLSRIESPLARAHIAAGLAALGDQGRAANAFEKAVEALGYENNGDWYQSPRRDLAGVIALAAEAEFFDVVEDLTPRLEREIPEPRALSTQEKSFVILASAAIAGDVSDVSVDYDGDAPDASQIYLADTSLEAAGTLTNTGERPIWMTVLSRGNPATPPAAVTSDLKVDKRLLDLSGNRVDLDTISRGDRLIISLTMTAERAPYASYILADLLPAGFEIEAIIRPEDAGTTGPYRFLGELARPGVSEARDDRFIAAIDTRGDVPQRVAYLVRAVSVGDFAFPGAIAEDMYRPDVFARSSSARITIAP